jgi:pilus assembly protein CpaE
MDKLRVVAVTSSEESRAALSAQLGQVEHIQYDGVAIELYEAVHQCQKRTPDIIICELTGREIDAGLFMQAINMNIENPSIIIALHRQLTPDIAFEAVRQGARDIIQYPDEQDKMAAAMKKYVALLRRNMGHAVEVEEKKLGKFLALFASKGGSGTSTIAVNVAHEIQQSLREPVLLLDMDLCFNNTAVILNAKPSYSLGDLSQSKATDIDEGLIKKVIYQHDSGLELLVGSKSVMDDNELIAIELLDRILNYAAENYSYIVVDLPSRLLDHYHEYIVQRADMLLLVAALDIPSLYRTRQYLDLAKQFFDETKIKLVLNRCNQKAAYGMTNKNLEEEFHYPIFAHLTNDWDANVNANSLGCVLSKAAPNSELVKDLRKLSCAITGQESKQQGQAENDKKDNAGLLGKLFGGMNSTKRGEGQNASSKA